VDAAKSGGQEVRVGEVFVECAEKTGFPGFGFSLQGNNYALRGRRRLPEEKMQLTGSKDGGWEYTDSAGESKMEISAYTHTRSIETFFRDLGARTGDRVSTEA
jgi:hypothetical protein